MPRRMTGIILAALCSLAACLCWWRAVIAATGPPGQPAAGTPGTISRAALFAPVDAASWEYLAASLAAVSALTLAVAPWPRRGSMNRPPRCAHTPRPAHRVRDAMQALLSTVRGMVVEIDHDGRLLRVVRSADTPEGFDASRLEGKNIALFLDAEALAVVRQAISRTLAEKTTREVDFAMDRKDGRRHFQATLIPLGGRSTLAVAREVTDRKTFEEELKRHVFLDGLTGLPNRALFLDRLTHAIERIKRKPGYRFAVLFMDVDRFKRVNDSLGHSVGDRLLARIGRRIAACLRRVDTVARFGGDEFVLLLDEIDDERQAIRVAERIRDALTRPFALDQGEVFVSASIGIVYSTPDYTDPDQIVRDADTAMFKAKARGKGGYRVFHSRMHKQAASLLALETDLRRAVDRGGFEVHYQPILSLSPRRVVGVEALVRWRHPARGLVSPLEFVPLAEETGLIVPIGGFVLAEACRRVAAYNAPHAPHERIFVSVNLSARQFEHEALAEDIRGVLCRTGLAARLLKLEVTESAIAVNPGQAAMILERLRGLGVGLSMDDFGTGYSSLSHLHAFPFDTLKIDRSFISGLGQGGDKNAKIVHSILTLAKNLDMAVIAEGIETDSQLERLLAMDCRLGQGYRFARPAPFETALRDSRSTFSMPERIATFKDAS